MSARMASTRSVVYFGSKMNPCGASSRIVRVEDVLMNERASVSFQLSNAELCLATKIWMGRSPNLPSFSVPHSEVLAAFSGQHDHCEERARRGLV